MAGGPRRFATAGARCAAIADRIAQELPLDE